MVNESHYVPVSPTFLMIDSNLLLHATRKTADPSLARPDENLVRRTRALGKRLICPFLLIRDGSAPAQTCTLVTPQLSQELVELHGRSRQSISFPELRDRFIKSALLFPCQAQYHMCTM